MRTQPRRMVALAAGAMLASVLGLSATTAVGDPVDATADCSWATTPGVSLNQAFTKSAKAFEVPVSVLKAVSYLESRWDDHDGLASSDGGYGPMNLTDRPAVTSTAKGDGSPVEAQSARTAHLGAELTGLDVATVKTDAKANVCAGAAVLASYYASPETRSDVNSWADSITRYGASVEGDQDFAKAVYTTMRQGEHRTTEQGEAMSLPPVPSAKVPGESAKAAKVKTDCPKDLDCEWLPAPYEKGDASLPDNTTDYGNHDIADRTGKGGPSLDYIVIHDTEGSYEGSVDLVQDPTYLAWNYTIRSSDGHIAQHLDAKNVGWHAGNWYMNGHSIGLEHEGKAGNGGWYTEAMYQNSAKLVKHLAEKYDIPLDPAHIIGHDQVPGILPGNTASMHWDPGPYWDWEHYFDLLGAPIGGDAATTTDVAVGDVVTVRPGYAGNEQTLTDCEKQSPGSGDCEAGAPTNFSLLHQEPSDTAPLAKDIGTHPKGDAAGTTVVNDVSARAQAGNQLVVAGVQDDWVKVSWAGEFAWVHNPVAHPVLVRTASDTISVKQGQDSAPVYGRAYPEAAAYPDGLDPEEVTPIEYTLKPGQSYAVTDATVVTDYYRAKSFDGSAPNDRTDITGEDVYYQISLAHRTFFVRAADVDLTPKLTLTNVSKPRVSGHAQGGRTVTALTGTWNGGAKTFSYQWLKDDKAIPGATDQEYQVTKEDGGEMLRVQVTAHAPNAGDEAVTSRPVPVRHGS